MKKIGVKKAFTLVELIIVIILISTTYYLVFSSSNFEIKNSKKNFSFLEIKNYLINNFDFNNNITFVCIDDSFDCFIKIDETIDTKQKYKNIFSSKPEVYEYNKDQIQKTFEPIRIDDIDYDVVFELTINSDYKSKDLILDTLEDRVYIFNSIYSKPIVYDSLSEAFEVFEKNILEVKDAF